MEFQNLPYSELLSQTRFSKTEPGINHPFKPGFIKISDSGDIEISAGEGCTIIMNPNAGSITLVADTINFRTKEEAGLRLNNLIFNTRATNFSEPTFLKFDPDETINMYSGASHYLDDIEEPGTRVIDPITKEELTWEEYVEKFGSDPVWKGDHFE